MTQETHPRSTALLRQLNQRLGITDRIVVEREVEYSVFLVQENRLNKTLIGKFLNRQQLDNALEMLLMFLRLTNK